MTLYLLYNRWRVECKNVSFITGKVIEAEAVTYFKILQRDLPEVTDENHEVSRHLVSLPKI